MEERYEIRGKIGQGGLGAVYRGYDLRMNREVAIKRISAGGGGDDALEQESTRQLIKEAGALASLQHPHIVTVYDVGSDEDGPYVVMELISGKTLDELIEVAPLTWSDFRELAMQTQEALIAAQELNLIHSDLKPSNIMLTWLPSGKFQIKIVDFGLATLAQSQSYEDLEALEAVFGSIFFMPPEQFERKPLDSRSDLYSLGCVYYQALAGCYPFDGETGNEVMTSHLHHDVKPLQEVRADIPVWVCDWVMWHLNRMPDDRPESARESLSVFLQNDKNPDPTMSLGQAKSAAVKRPRLIIPGSTPAPAAVIAEPVVAVAVATAVPIASARLATPARVTTAIAPAIPSTLPPDPVSMPETKPTKSSAPQPLTPPEGSKPSVHTSPQAATKEEPAPTAVAVPVGTRSAQAVVAPTMTAAKSPKPKRKLSNAAKSTIAALLGLSVVFLLWYMLERSGKNRETALYNEMIAIAAKSDATEVPVDAIRLDVLLNSIANVALNEQRSTVYKALFLAKATDATDVDARLVEFATTQPLAPDIRKTIIRDVLRMRKNPAIIPPLLAFATSTPEPASAVAALEAVRFMAGDDQFDEILGVLLKTKNLEIRKAAEETLAEIISKSPDRNQLATRLVSAYQSTQDNDIRFSLLRLLGRCGGPQATELVKKALASENKDEKLAKNEKQAAIVALGAWGDDSNFPLLTEFLATNQDLDLRNRAFTSALRFVSDSDHKRAPDAQQKLWEELSAQARTQAEQMDVIRGLVNLDEPWAVEIIKAYAKSEDDKVLVLAEKALEAITERKRARGKE